MSAPTWDELRERASSAAGLAAVRYRVVVASVDEPNESEPGTSVP